MATNDNYQINDSFLSFPALVSAIKIGRKAARLNFDWDDPLQAGYKVEEEWQELKEEMAPGNGRQGQIQEELGDLLFSVAQLARHLNIDPAEALSKANEKFIRRFNKMEDLLKKDGRNMEEMKQAELDRYWDLAKMKK